MLFRRMGSLRSPEAFRVWLYQIAHDQVVTLIRKQQREQTMLARLQHEVKETDIPEPEVDEAEHVHRALPLLSPEHREVLLLHYLEDMPLQEIAKSVRCQLGTVKSRLHYARRQMRQLLEKMKHEWSHSSRFAKRCWHEIRSLPKRSTSSTGALWRPNCGRKSRPVRARSRRRRLVWTFVATSAAAAVWWTIHT